MNGVVSSSFGLVFSSGRKESQLRVRTLIPEPPEILGRAWSIPSSQPGARSGGGGGIS